MGGLGRRRIIRLAVVGITAAIILLAACNGDEPPTPTATPAPPTPTPAPTSAPPPPTTAPAETPSPTTAPTTVPTAAPPAPSPTPVAVEPTPAPLPPSDSTSFELVVDVSQGTDSESPVGLEAYPDATVSVNGNLVTLDTPGPSGYQNTLRGLE